MMIPKTKSLESTATIIATTVAVASIPSVVAGSVRIIGEGIDRLKR